MKNVIYILIGALVGYFLIKYSTKTIRKMINTNDIKNAFEKLKLKFPIPILITVEKMFRIETTHFKSGGFIKTLGAGMESFAPSYPYGWNSLKKFWDSNPQYKPISTLALTEGKGAMNDGGKVKKFLVFPTIEAGLATVAQLMVLRNNNAGSYFSTEKVRQDVYNNTIKNIKTAYV